MPQTNFFVQLPSTLNQVRYPNKDVKFKTGHLWHSNLRSLKEVGCQVNAKAPTPLQSPFFVSHMVEVDKFWHINNRSNLSYPLFSDSGSEQSGL